MYNNLIEIVEEYKNEIFDDKIYINPNFPRQKLENAIESYANLSDDETPLILINETVFSSFKEGMLITDKTIYFKSQFENPNFFHLKDIEYITLKKGMLGNKIEINNIIVDFTQPKKQSIILIVEILEKMLQNLPKDFDCYLSEGNEELEKERYEEAILNFDEALKLKSDAYVYLLRAISKCELKEYNEAIKDYDSSLNLKEDGHIYYLRGLTELELKKYNNAINDFNKSLELNPDNKDINIKKKFAQEQLKKIVTDFEKYKEEDEPKETGNMSNEFKTAYLKIIINMTFIDDGEIDEKELAELFLLMTRLELDKESRFEIRAYITEISYKNLISVETLLKIIKNNSEIRHYNSLMISLAKDLINIYFSTKNTINRNFSFLDEHKDLFELSDKEIDLAYDTVENDYKLLKENLDDDTIKKNTKELVKTAAAAGVPLAAVYMSGSVVGMSAAGITSGLATLGLGMGMTGGLAVVGIIGIYSYKGVKKITGANELDKYKTRELMLQDVIKQTQKTTSLIIDDINHIIKKLNTVMSSHEDLRNENESIIHLLTMRNAVNTKIQKELNLFQGALNITNEKSNQYQNSVYRLNCPKILNIDRLKSLIDNNDKEKIYFSIIENYEKKEIEKNNKIIEQFELKENISTETLDEMVEIFKTIGYFEVGNIVKGVASDGLNKIKGIFG